MITDTLLNHFKINQHSPQAKNYISLYNLASLINEGVIVEIGCRRGIATAFLYMNSKVPVIAVDDFNRNVSYTGFCTDDVLHYVTNVKQLAIRPLLYIGDNAQEDIGDYQKVNLLVFSSKIDFLEDQIKAWTPKLQSDSILAILDSDGSIGARDVCRRLVTSGEYQEYNKVASVHSVRRLRK